MKIRALSNLISAATLAVVLSGCGGSLPLFGQPAVPRELVEADLRTRFADSQVSTLTLDLQSIRWVDEHMSARFGEPLTFAESGYAPNRQVWVAFAEGRLSASIWPGGARNQPSPGKLRPPEVPPLQPDQPKGFTKALILIDPETGGIIAMTASPAP